MRVVIAGGHGKIAQRLARLLVARDDLPVALVRNPDHVEDLRALDAEPVLCDLEAADVDEVAGHLAEADAVVFAAGAGPGSGAARKETVDRAAAVLLADAAERAGVRRYLQVSAMGLDRGDQPGMDPVFAAYLRAKRAAEDDLRAATWTGPSCGRDGSPTSRAPVGCCSGRTCPPARYPGTTWPRCCSRCWTSRAPRGSPRNWSRGTGRWRRPWRTCCAS
jgi:NAD(P)-dependent dehydrogenase (short-subunit alcohol dehydrogenase family)